MREGVEGLLVQSYAHCICRYPTTLMYYSNSAADTSAFRGRPNFYMSTQQQALQAFASFKPTALLASICGAAL